MGLIPKERRFQLQELHWETFTEIMRAADPVVKAGGCRALELSKLCKYWRTEKVVEFMIRHGLSFIHDVSRCAYVDVSKHVTARHDYRIAANKDLSYRMQTCQCERHAPLNDQTLENLAEYPEGLALRIVRNFLR